MAGSKIFLSAGEASGERYGAMLIEAIRSLVPDGEFFGLGGASMEGAGLRRIVRAEDVAVMGITEVIAHAPGIYARYRRLAAAIHGERPSLAVLIDFPDVNLRLARTLSRLGVPVVYFVSPQVWAWKRWRIRAIRRYVTRMLVIFPFEERFYREQGIAAEFVGHPLASLEAPPAGRQAFACENCLDASKIWIGLLPGSRIKELRANLPPLLDAARLLGPAYEYVLPIAPTLTEREVRAAVEAGARQRSGSQPEIRLVRDARATLLHCRVSAVASGTATVEAALTGNPFVAVYRMSSLSYAIARRVIRVPHAVMVNLIAGREVAPELIQRDFTGENVARRLRELIEDGPSRATMQAQLRAVGGMLRLSPDRPGPIERAAAIAVETMRRKLASAAPAHS